LRDRYQGNNRETNEFAKLDMQQGAIFKQVVAKQHSFCLLGENQQVFG
jgi:hypothetical protein